MKTSISAIVLCGVLCGSALAGDGKLMLSGAKGTFQCSATSTADINQSTITFTLDGVTSDLPMQGTPVKNKCYHYDRTRGGWWEHWIQDNSLAYTYTDDVTMTCLLSDCDGTSSSTTNNESSTSTTDSSSSSTDESTSTSDSSDSSSSTDSESSDSADDSSSSSSDANLTPAPRAGHHRYHHRHHPRYHHPI